MQRKQRITVSFLPLLVCGRVCVCVRACYRQIALVGLIPPLVIAVIDMAVAMRQPCQCRQRLKDASGEVST